jgi:hypothetical protein
MCAIGLIMNQLWVGRETSDCYNLLTFEHFLYGRESHAKTQRRKGEEAAVWRPAAGYFPAWHIPEKEV